MDLKAPAHALDRFQQRHRVPAVVAAVIKKFSDDQAGNLASLVAYSDLFSVFPLLLVFTTILGYVLSGDQSAYTSVENSVLGKFPVIGDSLSTNRLSGHAAGLIIGLALALWAGLGVTRAAANALDQAWGVPRRDRPGFVGSRLRGLILLASLGAMFIVASAASGVVTGGLGGPALQVAGYILSLALNFGLFLVAFQVLSCQMHRWLDLVPGALLSAIFWTILQTIGAVYINHIKDSSPAAGAFAVVIGVLAWLHLGSQLTMYSIELNTVLAKRAWPCSLFSEAEELPEPAQRDAA
jgi:YihY family inner membrane protein